VRVTKKMALVEEGSPVGPPALLVELLGSSVFDSLKCGSLCMVYLQGLPLCKPVPPPPVKRENARHVFVSFTVTVYVYGGLGAAMLGGPLVVLAFGLGSTTRAITPPALFTEKPGPPPHFLIQASPNAASFTKPNLYVGEVLLKRAKV
jgi:hypothetical protein